MNLTSNGPSGWWPSILRCPDHPEHPLPGGRCVACGRTYPETDGVFDLLPACDEFTRAEVAQWDGQAPDYERRRAADARYRAGAAAVAREVGAVPGVRVLEVGCGTGMVHRGYARPGLEVVALDLSAESLRRLGRSLPDGYPIRLVRGTALALPFADASFDVVVCANTVQHIPTDHQRRRAVGEFARVCRAGGQVVVSAHHLSAGRRRAGYAKEGRSGGGHSGAVQYIRRFSTNEFADLLRSGLQAVRLRGAGFPLPYRFGLGRLSRIAEWVLNRSGMFLDGADMLVGVGSAGDRPLSRPSPFSPAGQHHIRPAV